jgi:cytochrome c oxidase cbb3-type subunit 3
MTQTEIREEYRTDHSYDGIQEYDNPLPGWWKNLFIATIAFAVFYLIYFHAGAPGRTIQDSFDREAAAVFELRYSRIGILEPNRETLLKFMNDKEWLAVGRSVFKANCVSCHGAEAQGIIGPNLTDDHWINVEKIEDIARVIGEGAANGSMPAWKNRMTHPNQIVLTAAYVASLRSQPVPGKAPEPKSKIIKPWSE